MVDLLTPDNENARMQTVEAKKSELQQVVEFRQVFARLLAAHPQFFHVSMSKQAGWLAVDGRFYIENTAYDVASFLKPGAKPGELVEQVILELVGKAPNTS